MYESFYGFSEKPFSLAPDPRYFFESTGHKRGLAYLHYGLHQGQGFIVVTGMPGTGKSTLVHNLLHSIPSNKTVIATINNTNLDAESILKIVANSFGIYQVGDDKAATLSKLEKYFYQQYHKGKQVILLVDEAQNLPLKSLEELRMLSNFQHGNQMLVQIMLVGQKQLQAILADKEMEQLTQRVIASYHLEPMGADETHGYIRHRLLCAGWQGRPSFTAEALSLVFQVTSGVPRLINVFCDRLLLYGYLEELQEIALQDVQAVVDELKREAAGNWLNIQSPDELVVALPPLPLPGDTFVADKALKPVSPYQDEEDDLPVLSDALSMSAPPVFTGRGELDVELGGEQIVADRRDAATRPSYAAQSVAVKAKGGHTMTYVVVIMVTGILLVASALYMEFGKTKTPATVGNQGSVEFPGEHLIINEGASEEQEQPSVGFDVLPAAEEVAPQPVDEAMVEPLVAPVPETNKPATVSRVVREAEWNSLVNDIRGVAAASVDQEAGAVVEKLVASYQQGSITKFVGLFAADATVDGARGRLAITKEYEGVFSSSSSREMRIDGMQWHSSEEGIAGKGTIQISVWPIGSLKPDMRKGSIEIEAVKKGDQMLIKKMVLAD